jgi:predicted amidohydrolase
MKRCESRRIFLQKIGATAGVATVGTIGAQASGMTIRDEQKLPREVWIGSFSQMDLTAPTQERMVDQIFKRLENIVVYQPDIICLPECFPFGNVEKKYSTPDRVTASEYGLAKAAAFSVKNSCYSVCPVVTSENGKAYNSAVIFDRKGQKIGEYRKTHLTEGEINNGLTPGPLCPPVFKTDFGIIGVQICFDLLWEDSWAALKEQGAEIVFFASAFAGGQAVNAKAWRYQYAVVSSTRKNTSKICDITGEVISQTGIWNANLICAPINLEKAFLHLWPYNRRFNEIQQRYGKKVLITLFHEEEWAVIESRSPEVKVKDIMKEYELATFEELTRASTIAQKKARG